jgi:hypothetical protein
VLRHCLEPLEHGLTTRTIFHQCNKLDDGKGISSSVRNSALLLGYCYGRDSQEVAKVFSHTTSHALTDVSLTMVHVQYVGKKCR